MADSYVGQTPRTGNGNGKGNGHYPFPLSRKAFHRGLPRRVGTIEDQLDHFEQRLDKIICRLTELEAQPAAIVPDPAIAVRMDNIVEIVGRLAARLQRIDKRSLRSRRKVAVLADQVEISLE